MPFLVCRPIRMLFFSKILLGRLLNTIPMFRNVLGTKFTTVLVRASTAAFTFFASDTSYAHATRGNNSTTVSPTTEIGSALGSVQLRRRRGALFASSVPKVDYPMLIRQAALDVVSNKFESTADAMKFHKIPTSKRQNVSFHVQSYRNNPRVCLCCNSSG